MAGLPVDPVQRTVRRGAWGITAFWLLLLGLLFLGFDYVEQRRVAGYQAHEGSGGELVIPRGRDGHFHVDGLVNGQAVSFLVDTGATSVTVSEALALRADLQGGQPVTFQTANGRLPGRLLRQVPVQVGHLALPGVTVAVGMVGKPAEIALLGQSFLSRYDIQILQNEMRLVPRQ
jgi:aspartyl protease family protein